MEGGIREKAKFPMIRGPDGSVQRAAFSRYFVRILNDPGEEALMDDKHLRRDKKVFTKQHLRSFLKNSLQREAWIGAPWLVKEHLAIQYRLPMEIPAHLLQDAKLLATKVPTACDLVSGHADVLQQQMLQTKPPRNRRSGQGQDLAKQQQQLARMHLQQVSNPSRSRKSEVLSCEQQPGAPLQQMQAMQNHQQQHLTTRMEPKPPPPPVIKYPIEDLDLPPKPNGVSRPELKFFTDEMTEFVKNDRRTVLEDIEMRSMGLLLEVWNTLNVQCEVYLLDSFTFDDFVDAMRYTSDNPPCELLEEVHCAVLKQLVDKHGKVEVGKGILQNIAAEAPEDISEVHDGSELSTPQPDVPARSTRSRLSHVDPAIHNPRSPVSDKPHRAAEMVGERNWTTRIVSREFENGGWQVILVGLLHQLSHTPSFKSRCDAILAELAPMDLDATHETARAQYYSLNLNLRISALQMIVMLSLTTHAVKAFLEDCGDDMTEVRKNKIEHQRAKKAFVEELHVKDRERKIMWPANMEPEHPSAEPTSVNGDDTLETNGAGSSDVEDEASTTGRSLRRGNDRKRKREEEAARREKEKAEKAEAAKAQSKQAKEFKKILHDIEELKRQIKDREEQIQDCDADLREANVQRTRALGTDRFCNRYYWFERNGQPFGGLPSSSTASYGYANGRIWVQGPDALEAGPLLERTPEEQKEYQAHFRMTVPERRKREEGPTMLKNAFEWGFYDDPDRLDKLIAWLDDRGVRERKLRKELCDWRDIIVQYMEAFRNFRDQEAAKKLDVDEEPPSRIGTRHKVQEDRTAARERCLKWHNTMVLEEIKELHSRPSTKKKAAAKQQKGVATTVNRSTKPLTRQGTKYDFNK